MKYLYPLVAIHNNGYTVLLYSNDDVTNFIKKYGRWHNHFTGSTRNMHPWIVQDDRGRVVTVDDFISSGTNWKYYNKRQAEVCAIAAKGLPIPGTGCSKVGWKINYTAKKNSGSGHRNRNRAKAIDDFKEYGIKNKLGRVISYEGW
jgi:hypothetical protein